MTSNQLGWRTIGAQGVCLEHGTRFLSALFGYFSMSGRDLGTSRYHGTSSYVAQCG